METPYSRIADKLDHAEKVSGTDIDDALSQLYLAKDDLSSLIGMFKRMRTEAAKGQLRITD